MPQLAVENVSIPLYDRILWIVGAATSLCQFEKFPFASFKLLNVLMGHIS
jgi:hypothetical protein